MSKFLNQKLENLKSLVRNRLTVVEYYSYNSEYNETDRCLKLCYSFDELKSFIKSFHDDQLFGESRGVVSISTLEEEEEIENAAAEYYEEYYKIREESYNKQDSEKALLAKEKRRQDYLKLKEEFDNEDVK